MRNFLFVLIFALPMISCTNMHQPDQVKTYQSSEIIHLDAAITTRSIRLGVPFSVQLVSNPSTGFRWNLILPIKQGTCFKFLREGDFISSQSTLLPGLRLVGAPGIQEWVIEPTCSGTYVLEWTNTRPWETEAPPIATRQLHLKVN